MARRREAGLHRDLRDRPIGVREARARDVEPALTNVLAGRAAEPLAKRARQIHRVHTRLTCDDVERQRGRRSVLVEPLAHVTQPRRRDASATPAKAARHECDQLEDEPFDRERRCLIPNGQLTPDLPTDQSGGRRRRGLGRGEDCSRDRIHRDPLVMRPDDDAFRSGRTVDVRMHHRRGSQQEMLPSAIEPPAGNPLRDRPAKHDRRGRHVMGVGRQDLPGRVDRPRDRERARVRAVEQRA